MEQQDQDDQDQESSSSPSPSTFLTVYQTILFFLSLYLAGDLLCGRIIRILPPLVGQIGMGMVWGPHGFNWIDTAFLAPLSILGEVGLVLLLCQAGLNMDIKVLQQVGPRAMVMALLGSILPTMIGTLLAYTVLLDGRTTDDNNITAALAVGCSFGPTSAGIALNVLQPCGVLATPLGQLIVAIAIIDDIIALVVLSQLKALTTTNNDTVAVAAIVVPIGSALAWLFVGGGIALYVMPRLLVPLEQMEQSLLVMFDRSKQHKHKPDGIIDNDATTTTTTKNREQSLRMVHVVLLMVVLLPATYYSQSSHLLGSFLAGLSLCHQRVPLFDDELRRIIDWLMRLFFGATIAFSIPLRLFRNGRVIANGAILCLALLGKVVIGPLLTPVLPNNNDDDDDDTRRRKTDDDDHDHADDGDHPRAAKTVPVVRRRRRRWDRQHLRDCLIVGFSMAGEAEFALVVAAFGYSAGLVSESIYASTVLAILASTIISPCLLRITLVTMAAADTGEAYCEYNSNADDKDDPVKAKENGNNGDNERNISATEP
jgi:Kef-type K+ transport system membrane component KefB